MSPTRRLVEGNDRARPFFQQCGSVDTYRTSAVLSAAVLSAHTSLVKHTPGHSPSYTMNTASNNNIPCSSKLLRACGHAQHKVTASSICKQYNIMATACWRKQGYNNRYQTRVVCHKEFTKHFALRAKNTSIITYFHPHLRYHLSLYDGFSPQFVLLYSNKAVFGSAWSLPFG